MLFHERIPEPKGFSPKTGAPAPVAQYAFSALRGFLGFAFFLLLIIGSFIAKSQNWDDGANVLLHMSEVAFGGIAGIIFGERLAIKNVT